MSNTSKRSKRESYERSKRMIIVVIVAFTVVVLGLAIIFPAITGGGLGSMDRNVVDVPRVSTTVASSKDGSTHSLRAKFSIEMAKDAETAPDANTLQGKITDIMGSLDYDRMNADGSDTYIKESISEGLSSYVDPSQIKGIYITEFQSGDAMVPLDDSDAVSPRDRIMRGLFQNMN